MRQFKAIYFSGGIIIIFLLLPFFSQFVFGGRAENAAAFSFPQLEYIGADFRDPFSPQVFLPAEILPDAMPPAAAPVKPERPGIAGLFAIALRGVIWDTDIPLAIISSARDQVVVGKGQDLSALSDERVPGGEIKVLDISREGVTLIYLGETEFLTAPALNSLRP